MSVGTNVCEVTYRLVSTHTDLSDLYLCEEKRGSASRDVGLDLVVTR